MKTKSEWGLLIIFIVWATILCSIIVNFRSATVWQETLAIIAWTSFSLIFFAAEISQHAIMRHIEKEEKRNKPFKKKLLKSTEELNSTVDLLLEKEEWNNKESL